MYKRMCSECKHEWIDDSKLGVCPNCERMVQAFIRDRRDAFIRRQEAARRLAGIPANDRMELCDEDEGGCGLPLAGNSYFEDSEDGEKQRICDSCGHATRVPSPPMMYQMNEKDWRSKY